VCWTSQVVPGGEQEDEDNAWWVQLNITADEAGVVVD
jgi:hypothetical protein